MQIYAQSFTIDPEISHLKEVMVSALGVEFTIQTPTGRLVDINDYDNNLRYITSSQSPSVKFTQEKLAITTLDGLTTKKVVVG